MKVWLGVICVGLAAYLGFIMGMNQNSHRQLERLQAENDSLRLQLAEVQKAVATLQKSNAPQMQVQPKRVSAEPHGDLVIYQDSLGGTRVRELPPGVSHMQSIGGGN